jgi:hypothetical protein
MCVYLAVACVTNKRQPMAGVHEYRRAYLVHHKDLGPLQDGSCHAQQLLLSVRHIERRHQGDEGLPNPVEKLSPLSDTCDSRFLKIFELISGSLSADSSSLDGMR